LYAPPVAPQLTCLNILTPLLDRLRLPKWRLALRDYLIPIIRWETPHLSAMQEKYRTPTLDTYFAFTANFGTHTAFMITLPILFWCGQVQIARA
jgi:hypothetical protein